MKLVAGISLLLGAATVLAYDDNLLTPKNQCDEFMSEIFSRKRRAVLGTDALLSSTVAVSSIATTEVITGAVSSAPASSAVASSVPASSVPASTGVEITGVASTAVPGTNAPTTKQPTTTNQPITATTKQATTDPNRENSIGPVTTLPETVDTTTIKPTSGGILIILDETGSMQKIHQITTKKGKKKNKGRKIIIDAMNTLITKLQDEQNQDIPISIVSFNTKAKIQNFQSVDDVPKFNSQRYNPGGQTNMNDALGCALSKFRESRHKNVKVYVVSDGTHNIYNPAYSSENVGLMVEKLRSDDGWEFNFYGAAKPEDQGGLQNAAIRVGFESKEVSMFMASAAGVRKIAKTMLDDLIFSDTEKKQAPKKKQGPNWKKLSKKCAKEAKIPGKKGKKALKKCRYDIAKKRCGKKNLEAAAFKECKQKIVKKLTEFA